MKEVGEYAIRILREMNGTHVRIVIKHMLCEEAGIRTQMVPESIEQEVDDLMTQIYRPAPIKQPAHQP